MKLNRSGKMLLLYYLQARVPQYERNVKLSRDHDGGVNAFRARRGAACRGS
jgi:hypothetical protein